MSSNDIIIEYIATSVKKTGFTAAELFLKPGDGAIERYDIICGIILLKEVNN